MTCDLSRPCKRCIKRGLEATCQDAPRKLKKYMAGLEERNIQKLSPDVNENSMRNTVIGNIPEVLGEQSFEEAAKISTGLGDNTFLNGRQNEKNYHDFIYTQQSNASKNVYPMGQNGDNLSLTSKAIPNELMRDFSQIPVVSRSDSLMRPLKNSKFLSSAADLEYATLSNILQENFRGLNTANSSAEGTPSSYNLSPSNLSPPSLSPSLSSHGIPNNMEQLPVASTEFMKIGSGMRNYGNLGKDARLLHQNGYKKSSRRLKCDEHINQYFIGKVDSEEEVNFPDVINAIELMKEQDPSVFYERQNKLSLSFTIGISADHGTNDLQDTERIFKEPEEIYAKVIQPFSYTPGYHSLIAYLRKRFPREMLVKMAESMAKYRPSFIACTNSLKESDLIFMEQCFQRTLLTYDSFIRVSGTPTIVWRRTGEIAYVGHEFCVLTGWSREALLLKEKKFIVELLDDKSVLEYFQLFLRIAFGDFLGATMTECTLLTPNEGVKIRASCIWTLKRDVFGIPMMIIGNFLPIL